MFTSTYLKKKNLFDGLLKATKNIYLVPQNRKRANNSYGSYPTNLQAELKILKKIIGTPNLPKISQKNRVSYLKSGKEPKICMGATRRNLQARPKILKKISEHQINQSERNPFQKI
jgi:hypothetical protein